MGGPAVGVASWLFRGAGMFLKQAAGRIKASVAGRVFGSAAKAAVQSGAVRATARGAAAVGGAVVTGTAFEAGRRVMTPAAPAPTGGGEFPAPPSGSPPGGGFGAPAPIEGVFGRTLSRILPGGRTGMEFMPYEGTETDKYGRPIAVYPAQAARFVAPRGYVIVRNPQNPEQALAILKGAARAMGLWSAKPKPPISGYDRRAIERASRVKKRMKKLARKVERL
jgi:hypothetical protein